MTQNATEGSIPTGEGSAGEWPGNVLQHTLTRRELQASLVGAGGALAVGLSSRADAKSGSDGDGDPSLAKGGFPTPPFVDALEHLNLSPYLIQPVSIGQLNPPPGEFAAGGEARRERHPAWATCPPQLHYEMVEEENRLVKLHRDLPYNTMWGFRRKDDPLGKPLVPGPTFHTTVGKPILVRIRNGLPQNHVGYGKPETSTHLHDNHNTPESDGNADDYYPKTHELNPADNDPGLFKDFHWINKAAGSDPTDPIDPKKGDPREAMGTLWYHDHRHSFTAANTYKGLVGFYLVFDAVDNNNEAAPDDPSLSAEKRPLKLPSGKYDVPLVIADKLIDSSGNLVFDQLEMDGILGNKITVNGKIQPFFKVERRQYRFRILNAGPSRTYGLSVKTGKFDDLRDAVFYPHVYLIGQAGTLLPNALPLTDPTKPVPAILVPANRAEAVVDFSFVPPGHHVYLVNQYAQSNGNKPDGFIGNTVNGPQFKAVIPGLPILRADIDESVPPGGPYTPITTFLPPDLPGLPPDLAAFLSVAGRKLRDLPDLTGGVEQLTETAILAAVGKSNPFPAITKPAPIATVRDFRFDRTNGQWAINNRLYDGDRATMKCKRDTAEIWVIRNNSGGWIHPVHIHFEKFRVLFRANGIKPNKFSPQNAREDTLSIGPNERAVIYMRFRDIHSVESSDPRNKLTAKYLMHCHNTVHEDHAMMLRWDIVA
jgi:FtsP/CotA-like multicopper oxidase with cupredoxin domain